MHIISILKRASNLRILRIWPGNLRAMIKQPEPTKACGYPAKFFLIAVKLRNLRICRLSFAGLLIVVSLSKPFEIHNHPSEPAKIAYQPPRPFLESYQKVTKKLTRTSPWPSLSRI
jgi:hypothetical protein